MLQLKPKCSNFTFDHLQVLKAKRRKKNLRYTLSPAAAGWFVLKLKAAVVRAHKLCCTSVSKLKIESNVEIGRIRASYQTERFAIRLHIVMSSRSRLGKNK